ncbi:MAG: hypothetical protein EAZ36_05850 [Verrucomicrobia bacterium]|nr:MAG: hypothetical protein EAZ36_05850 [Verrucomicrobiota bacterium]
MDMRSIRERSRQVLPGASSWVSDVIDLTDRLFTGQMAGYQRSDLRYHDYQHTLQATWVYLDLVESALAGRGRFPVPSQREVELGLAAMLFHDTGYLKARGDDEGTGAKYTHSHVARSCGLAAAFFPALGCVASELEDVLAAIRCTGLGGKTDPALFRSPNARFIGCLVATADYLGQMAAPEYPSKLPFLFTEFTEADDYAGVPLEKRTFSSAAQLLGATAGFWQTFVLPKLENEFAGVHRLLRRPWPGGANPYLVAIERNLTLISARSNPPFVALRP